MSTGWAIVLVILLGLTVALGVAVLMLEKPARVERFTRTRRWTVVGLAVSTVAILVVVVTEGEPTPIAVSNSTPIQTVPPATVLRVVKASNEIRTVPSHLDPPLLDLQANPEAYISPTSTGCRPSSASACIFGDRTGTHTMVLYGDSHAGMWFKALDDIAIRAHWKLDVFVTASCPAAPLSTHAVGGSGDWAVCDQSHRSAIAYINRLDPDLLIVSQTSPYQTPVGSDYTPKQWQRGLEQLFEQVRAPRTVKVVLGNLPGSGGPACIAQHVDDVQACSAVPNPARVRYDRAERRAAEATGGRYVDVRPWFCAAVCSSVIGNYDVYLIGNHVTEAYSIFLEGVLAQKLGLK